MRGVLFVRLDQLSKAELVERVLALEERLDRVGLGVVPGPVEVAASAWLGELHGASASPLGAVAVRLAQQMDAGEQRSLASIAKELRVTLSELEALSGSSDDVEDPVEVAARRLKAV